MLQNTLVCVCLARQLVQLDLPRVLVSGIPLHLAETALHGGFAGPGAANLVAQPFDRLSHFLADVRLNFLELATSRHHTRMARPVLVLEGRHYAATVAMTICDPSVETPLPAQPIDPPTLAMIFRVNDSPLAGTEGDKVTGRMIRDRLLREAEGNVALRVRELMRKISWRLPGAANCSLAF